MKKLILVFTILIGLSAVASAQSSSKQMKQMKMKPCVMMVDNKVMLCKKNKCTPLTNTYTCSNGCKISTDGTITKPDGTTMKLMNGYQADKNGKVDMISHGQKGHVCGKDCHPPMSNKKQDKM